MKGIYVGIAQEREHGDRDRQTDRREERESKLDSVTGITSPQQISSELSVKAAGSRKGAFEAPKQPRDALRIIRPPARRLIHPTRYRAIPVLPRASQSRAAYL